MTNSTRTTSFRAVLALGAALVFAAACSSDDTTGPTTSPLAGLAQAAAHDSMNAPAPSGAAASGFFRGTVLGPSTPGQGGDTLATAPRVSGAVVTAYLMISGGSNPDLGAAAATVTTGADGKFVLPTLAGGTYVVTITPPSSSIYSGVWVTATTSATSDDNGWWVVLPKK